MSSHEVVSEFSNDVVVRESGVDAPSTGALLSPQATAQGSQGCTTMHTTVETALAQPGGATGSANKLTEIQNEHWMREFTVTKRYLSILGVAKLTRTSCSAAARRCCNGGGAELAPDPCKCKTCNGKMRCPGVFEEFSGLAFRVVGTGVATEDFDSFSDAIGKARTEGFVTREEGVEKLLSRIFSHGSQKIVLILSSSPREQIPLNPSGSGEATSSSAEVVTEYLYSALGSIARFLDGPREEREYAAVTVNGSSTFDVVLPTVGQTGPPQVQLHEADAKAKALGFWRRECMVEAFLSLLPLDNGNKIVHVFSKTVRRSEQSQ